jgi:hypothetical protein
MLPSEYIDQEFNAVAPDFDGRSIGRIVSELKPNARIAPSSNGAIVVVDTPDGSLPIREAIVQSLEGRIAKKTNDPPLDTAQYIAQRRANPPAWSRKGMGG